jgi:hypothetical protein
MQPTESPVPSAVLPSNVIDTFATDRQFEGDEPPSEAVADLLVAACGLALVVTGLVVVGPRLVGGPLPTLRFWTILGPLLIVPLMILIGLLLAPGGITHGRRASWQLRVALGIGGLVAFLMTLTLLNLPTLLTGR